MTHNTARDLALAMLNAAKLAEANRQEPVEAAAKVLEKAMGWRGIDDAPKDGSRFLACCVCATSGERWVTGDVWWHRDHWCSDSDGTVAPTRWMPLPEPPREE